ncbi:phosphatase PAP2 family protein [Yinghuangia soli]|uniref:Phosphatase PAP2 family protein n=1 Tax=Yinghuangia soli TaxID=2908204 RepID=A0AA41PXR1_9ACTN|nr:phosphatase PAP2 family protein [Yinghuangia soli]MCF2526452.1 phosphatase PAP2 family protein [Yinghuangia soli]
MHSLFRAPVFAPRPAALWYTAAVAAAAAVFGTLLLLVVFGWDMLFRVDARVARDLHEWLVDSPATTRTIRILSDWVWDPNTFRLLTLALAVALWAAGNRRVAMWAAAVMALGGLSGGLCKLAVARERPTFADPVDTAEGFSFPSGHALNGVLGCGVLVIGLWPYLPRRARPAVVAVAVVSAVGVGFTRIALGVHYLSDVVAGWALGIVVLGVFWLAFELLWDPVEAEITPAAGPVIDLGRPEDRPPG